VKRTLLSVLSISVVLLITLAVWLRHRAFHESDAWIVHSPAHSAWAVDLAPSGFLDISHDFRVHDLRASPFQPFYICDLYWEDRHYPYQLCWSRDGSIAAITVRFRNYVGELYGAAYDFREHRSFRSGYVGSPLDPSPELSRAIEQLMAERGGIATVLDVPDITKGP
jgi:hypothetical protein